MKYCSIEEAWGNNFKKNKEKFEIEKPKYVNSSIEFLSNELDNKNDMLNNAYKLYEGFTATGEYKENLNQKFDNYLEKFDKLMNFEAFRNKIIERMENIVGKKYNTNNTEHFSLYGGSNDDYSDVILYILFGIFIIFILDSFVKLGMKYKGN